MRAWQRKSGKNNGEEFLYQDGTLASILTVERILEYVRAEHANLENAVLFSGTVPVIGGFEYGDFFRAELSDPILGRVITHEYAVEVIAEGLE